MGRYTLTFETFDKQKINIEFKKNNKSASRVPLKTIDDLTTKVNSKEELANLLNLKEISKVKITYIYRQQEKTIPIAYSDKKVLSEVKTIDDNNISLSNTIFIKYMYEFLKLLEKKDFYNKIMSSDSISDKQKEYIYKRIKAGDYSLFCTEKIYEHSSSYRQFRNILFLVAGYKEMLTLQNEKKVDTDEDDYDPDKDGFMDYDEKIKYQEYLDNLPADSYEYEYLESKLK